jgi:hypothetical protein
MDKQIISDRDKVFATGVFLQPVNCIINGKQQWRWVAISFEDDSYYNGERIDIYDYADTLEGLIIDSEE